MPLNTYLNALEKLENSPALHDLVRAGSAPSAFESLDGPTIQNSITDLEDLIATIERGLEDLPDDANAPLVLQMSAQAELRLSFRVQRLAEEAERTPSGRFSHDPLPSAIDRSGEAIDRRFAELIASMADTGRSARISEAIRAAAALPGSRAQTSVDSPMLNVFPKLGVLEFQEFQEFQAFNAAASRMTAVEEAEFRTKITGIVHAVIGVGLKSARDIASIVPVALVGRASEQLFEIAGNATRLAEDALASAGFFRKISARLLRSAVAKLVRALGGARDQILNKLKALLQGPFKDAVGKVSAAVFGAETVVDHCVDAARYSTAEGRAAALEAAAVVLSRASLMAQVSDLVTDVLTLITPSPGPWTLAIAGAAVVGLALNVWQIQDLLDSTRPFPMPDVSNGILGAVLKALHN